MGKPNYIIVLTDDQGYGDLSCMGDTHCRTPNIDRLAENGARFTNWYAASPVCSPSRAALLTGRYPGNTGVRDILRGNRDTVGLSPEIPSLASELKKLGYQTALSGKWHLGVTEECRPHKHGFDRWMGFMAGCIDYFSHIFYWGMGSGRDSCPAMHDLWEDNREISRNGQYFTEMVTDYAVEFIRKASQKEEPFLLYVAYNAPHYPLHAPEKYTDRFAHLPWDRRMMAAMLSAVDDGVGSIMNELERQGITENTCVFFQSDNGPSREDRNWMDGTADPYYGGTTGKLKGHKYSLYDGGIRVPAIMSWPGKIPAEQVISRPGIAMDIFPTFVQAAGGDLEGYALDGRDILPSLTEHAQLPQADLFWEMGQQTAMRRGPWKLVLNGQLVEGAPVEDAVHLSNLDEDMGERVNLAERYPELTEEMQAAAQRWRSGMEAAI